MHQRAACNGSPESDLGWLTLPQAHRLGATKLQRMHTLASQSTRNKEAQKRGRGRESEERASERAKRERESERARERERERERERVWCRETALFVAMMGWSPYVRSIDPSSSTFNAMSSGQFSTAPSVSAKAIQATNRRSHCSIVARVKHTH